MGRENCPVHRPGLSRRAMTRTLNSAYAGGLLSDDTFARRVDQVLQARLLDPAAVIGDLNFRRAGRPPLDLWRRVRALLDRRAHERPRVAALLALDWSGAPQEMLIGRHHSCDVVLDDATVSRRHARLLFRDGRWIVQDLESTNGTAINGTRVGRCELRPGDHLALGDALVRID